MKNLILLFLPIFLTNQCKSQGKVIGLVENGQFVITVNSDSILVAVNNIVKKQGLKPDLTNLSIIEGIVDKTNQKYYAIKFSNADNTKKMVQLLTLDNARLAILHSTLEEGASITCSGCRAGCDPKRYVDKDNTIQFYCNDCTLGDTKNCTKTVTKGTLDL